MELDELKNTWQALNEKLKENNSLNDRIIKEMLNTKSNKSIGRLIGYEISGLCVLLVVLPVTVYGISLHSNFMEYTLFMYFIIVVILLLLIWQSVKLYELMRINLSKPLKENIRNINKYNIYIRKEKQIMLLFIPILVVMCSYIYVKSNVNLMMWIILTCFFVAVIILTIWSYKRLYNKNIKSILDSLEELKDLEQE